MTKKYHFIGIGGIGMSALAFLMKDRGFEVSGSDHKESEMLNTLRERGVISYGSHLAEQVPEDSIVIISSAINENNIELLKAKSQGLKVLKRAELLAEIVNSSHGITIAGSHGKTTTSGLLTYLLHKLNFEHTSIIGGWVEELAGNYRSGSDEFVVAEADESDGSFLLYQSDPSAITNIDLDHMEHFQSEEKLVSDFLEFIHSCRGTVYINGDDSRLRSLPRIENVKTVGFKYENDYVIEVIKMDHQGCYFNLSNHEYFLPMLGKHNILNAAQAILLALNYVPDKVLVSKALSSFNGVHRRQQVIYDGDNLVAIEDYAHHPTEIEQTIKGYQEHFRYLTIVYQPHRYSRLKSTWKEHLQCFQGANEIFLLPLYSAGEQAIEGINSYELANHIHATVIDSLNLVPWREKQGVVVFMGAGDIGVQARRYFGK